MPNPEETLRIQSAILAKLDALQGDAKAKYLAGLRDGAELASLMAEDNGWGLSRNAGFQQFFDDLDAR